jgi:CRISPR-associated protein Cmx8
MSKEKSKEELEPMEFDPLRPDYTAQHRAGIAGLLLQFQAMEILREQANTEEEKARYIIPEHTLTNNERSLWVKFTKESFDSVMRERYRGKFVQREYSKKMKEGNARKFIEKIDIAKGKSIFKYEELRPSFEYFEAFSAPLAWQEQIRDSTWSSFFCIPTMQSASFKIQSNDENKDVTALWKGLLDKKFVEAKKTYYLNTWTEGLKGEEISDNAEKCLLLHFWGIVSTIFTPTSLKIDKNERGLVDFKTEYQKPVVVVPDVAHIGTFTVEFRRYLEKREHLDAKKRKHPDLFISTPREAALQFFMPQLAQAQIITESITGARGAEVYCFKSAGQQAIVASFFNEPLEDYTRDLISDYGFILREIKSFPYRALQVENLLAKRKWHDGFDRLADKFPHELFVPKNFSNDSTKQLKKQAFWMAQSILADFRIHTEVNMNEKQPNLER